MHWAPWRIKYFKDHKMGIDHIGPKSTTGTIETEDLSKSSPKVSEGAPESKVNPDKKMTVAEPSLMSRTIKITTEQNFSELQLKLLEKEPTQNPEKIREKLTTLGITEKTTDLPDDFAEHLFASPDFTLTEKQIIAEHFQPSFKAHYSRKAIEKDVNAYRESNTHKNATDKQIDLAEFQEALVTKAFKHDTYVLLISMMHENKSDQDFLDSISKNKTAILETLSYPNLLTRKTGAEAHLQIFEAIQAISEDKVFRGYTAKIAKKVMVLYEQALELEKPVLQDIPKETVDPKVQKAKEKELKKLFMDQEVLKSMAFIQSTQTETDAKILTFSRLKVNKSVMEKITESDEYKELMAELETVIFNDKTKEQLSDTLAALNLDPNDPARQKLFKKSMSKIRKQMVTNLKVALTDIQKHADTGKKLNPKYEKVADKLIAMIQKAGTEKIATRDTFNIVLKRIAIGIGIAIAAAVIGATIAYLLPLFLAATVATIVGYCIIVAFALMGFSVGISGNKKIMVKFSQFLNVFQGNTPNSPNVGAFAEA